MKPTIESSLVSITLISLLEETFEKVHGAFLDRGTSLFETLSNITADRASKPLVENGSTIAAHVHHITFYLNVLEKYMTDTLKEKIDWSQSWLVKTVNDDEWNREIEDLKQSHKSVLKILKRRKDWNNDNFIGGAMSVIVHTAYHLGAIRQFVSVVS